MLQLFRSRITIRSIVIVVLIVLSLFLLNCSNEAQPSTTDEGWAQRFETEDRSLSVPYLGSWEILEEKNREGVLSLHSEKLEDDYHVNLVVTILPVKMSHGELSKETARILELSLYNLHSIEDPFEKEYNELRVYITDAAAGDLEPIRARAAGFSRGGRTYLFTVLAREDSFEFALKELNQILLSIEE